MKLCVHVQNVVGGVARWLGRRFLTGGLSLIYAKKCMLMCVGKHYTAAGISVFIDNVALTKVTLFKYLGVSFVADRELNVDVS